MLTSNVIGPHSSAPQVFKCLDQQWAAKPQLSTENLLINELIRDYLEYNRYLHTAYRGPFSPKVSLPLNPPTCGQAIFFVLSLIVHVIPLGLQDLGVFVDGV